MTQSCGSLNFVDGGVLRGQTILNAQVSDSNISNSRIQATTLESLTGVEPAAAKTIVDAISALPPDQLATLVSAVLAALVATPRPAPAGTISEKLPTLVVGDRATLLGKPALFAAFGDYVIPLYQSGV